MKHVLAVFERSIYLKNFIAMSFVVLFTVMMGISAQAQTDTSVNPDVAAPSPNDIREFQRLLGDTRIQNWLKQAAEAEPSIETKGSGVGMKEQLLLVVQKIKQRRADLREAWNGISLTPEIITVIWQSEMSDTATLQAITYLVIFLVVGAGFEWLYVQYFGQRLLRLELQKFVNLKRRVRVALARAALIFGSLFVFALGSVGTFLSFDWPSMVELVVLEILIVILVVRVGITVSRFFLSPRVEDLRLVSLDRREAKAVHFWLAVIVTFGVVSLAISSVFEKLLIATTLVVPILANLSVAVMGMAIWAIVTLIAIWRIASLIANNRDGYGKPSANASSRTSARFWALYLSIIVGAIFLLWVINTNAVMGSVAIFGLLYPATVMLRNWVDYLFDQAESMEFLLEQSENSEVLVSEGAEEIADDAKNAAEPEDTTSYSRRYDTYRPIVRRIVRFTLIICSVAGLVLIWNNGVFSFSDRSTLESKIFEIIVDIIVALLIADLVWIWAKTAIDRRLADYVPPEDGHAPGPEARMATLLPLLRVILMVTLLTMVGLSVLASFGVNIAPLLAGAGVLGVAIGFGAQALVRDVVAGIFFLIDDAFRIGEYIEVEDLQGTVESMSIRSLRVRHHRGAVHTIPFGELKALTNYSRDWVIMKLEFRIPFDTDMQLVKKLVKKIGAELKENPEFSDSIIETLKSQGVRRMEEFNMVMGVKFMTKPGEQWVIRREAYHKVRDAFEANGIGFAERTVKVEVQSDGPLSDATKDAVMGAAQNAIESNLPAPPVPDEP
ncbi:MAG: hypothetical protein COA78_15080 [Blastopirellula sp.]|nr:MAG: hypothetical protein COA78_15080 [Blastopirellula sp.]